MVSRNGDIASHSHFAPHMSFIKTGVLFSNNVFHENGKELAEHIIRLETYSSCRVPAGFKNSGISVWLAKLHRGIRSYTSTK